MIGICKKDLPSTRATDEDLYRRCVDLLAMQLLVRDREQYSRIPADE